VRVLAVADVVDECLWHDTSAVESADVVLAAGDLPFDYLRHLAERLGVPLAFVPGNHDPDVSGYRVSRHGLPLRAGLPAEPPWPAGAVNADGCVIDVGGLTVAGLGGCLRYTDGPNQYTDRQFQLRARRLAAAARWRRLRRGDAVDVLLTHAPPRGVGDADDPPHRGVKALHRLVSRTHPQLLLHGHVHPYGEHRVDHQIGATRVCNVVGWRLFDIPTFAGSRDDQGALTGRGA
jgi:calcineurin-like phosphoesterase family protein